MCSTAQMRSRTIAGGARERDSLSRQQSGAAVFTPHRSARCSADRNAVRTGNARTPPVHRTSYMVLRRSSYPPNVITTVPKSKYARRYNVASNSSIPSVRRLLRSGPVAASARAPPSGLRGPGAREASTEEREPATTTHMPITCEMLSSGGCTCQHLRDQRPSTAHAQRRVL